MSVENYLPGDLCSGLIICWRKSSGEMSPGEKFLGEKCDEFLRESALLKHKIVDIFNFVSSCFR